MARARILETRGFVNARSLSMSIFQHASSDESPLVASNGMHSTGTHKRRLLLFWFAATVFGVLTVPSSSCHYYKARRNSPGPSASPPPRLMVHKPKQELSEAGSGAARAQDTSFAPHRLHFLEQYSHIGANITRVNLLF
jgi:hypothetical protein